MPRIAVLFVFAVSVSACGSDSPTAPSQAAPPPVTISAPAPQPTPAPAPAPPATTANISGTWSGQLRYQGDSDGGGNRRPVVVNIVAELEHDASGRVTGTWRSIVVGGNLGGPYGSFADGTVSGVGSAARFRGRYIHNAPSTDPSHRCEASVWMNGPSVPPSMRWEGETSMTFDKCLGSAAEIVVALNR
jgi:hypothetical protein